MVEILSDKSNYLGFPEISDTHRVYTEMVPHLNHIQPPHATQTQNTSVTLSIALYAAMQAYEKSFHMDFHLYVSDQAAATSSTHYHNNK